MDVCLQDDFSIVQDLSRMTKLGNHSHHAIIKLSNRDRDSIFNEISNAKKLEVVRYRGGAKMIHYGSAKINKYQVFYYKKPHYYTRDTMYTKEFFVQGEKKEGFWRMLKVSPSSNDAIIEDYPYQ